MDEAKIREIHTASDLSGYTHEALIAADKYVKDWAMLQLKVKLKDMPKPVREYIELMARCHYGSIETDLFLKEMGCYPQWLKVETKA